MALLCINESNVPTHVAHFIAEQRAASVVKTGGMVTCSTPGPSNVHKRMQGMCGNGTYCDVLIVLSTHTLLINIVL